MLEWGGGGREREHLARRSDGCQPPAGWPSPPWMSGGNESGQLAEAEAEAVGRSSWQKQKQTQKQKQGAVTA